MSNNTGAILGVAAVGIGIYAVSRIGANERQEVRQDQRTDRVEIRQLTRDSIIERRQIEKTNRVDIRQENRTDRTIERTDAAEKISGDFFDFKTDQSDNRTDVAMGIVDVIRDNAAKKRIQKAKEAEALAAATAAASDAAMAEAAAKQGRKVIRQAKLKASLNKNPFIRPKSAIKSLFGRD